MKASHLAGLTALLFGAASCKSCGCGKKEEEGPVNAPPPLGAASLTELTTGLGPARGLEEGIAPTSAKWRRAFALDDKRVVLVGETATHTLAIMTEDAGKSWRGLQAEKEGWANWNLAMDGSIVLAIGARAGAKGANEGAIEAAKFSFAAPEAPTLGPASPLFLPPKGFKGKVTVDTAIPAAVAPEYAAVYTEEGPKKAALVFGGRPGAEPVMPLKLPPAEKFVPVPYGRPPSLLSVRGKDLLVRPYPAPGKPLGVPQKVAGVVAAPTLAADLSVAPACDFGATTFQRFKQQNGKLAVLAIGGGNPTVIALPETTPATTAVGCSGARVIVEATDKDEKLVLVSCDFEGKCTEPQNTPFRPWPEKNEQVIQSVVTDKGVLAALATTFGDRWGIYMAQSNDGTIYEQPRVVGEGSGERGKLQLGMLVPVGVRVILLLSADITGTSRRGWYVTVTDDAGLTWNTP